MNTFTDHLVRRFLLFLDRWMPPERARRVVGLAAAFLLPLTADALTGPVLQALVGAFEASPAYAASAAAVLGVVFAVGVAVGARLPRS